jgi:hypothetical protein
MPAGQDTFSPKIPILDTNTNSGMQGLNYISGFDPIEPAQ